MASDYLPIVTGFIKQKENNNKNEKDK